MIDDSLFVARGANLSAIRCEVVVGAKPSAVFDALASEDGVFAFLSATSSIDLRIGGAYEIYFDEDAGPGQRGSEGCQVLAYVPGRMLAVSWNAPPELPEARRKRAWVVFLIDEIGGEGKSRLELHHTGLGADGEWPEVKAYFEKAWPRFLVRIVERFELDAKPL